MDLLLMDLDSAWPAREYMVVLKLTTFKITKRSRNTPEPFAPFTTEDPGSTKRCLLDPCQ